MGAACNPGETEMRLRDGEGWVNLQVRVISRGNDPPGLSQALPYSQNCPKALDLCHLLSSSLVPRDPYRR